jgi:hypothetical protein
MLRISPGVRAFQASKLGFTMGFGEKSTFGDKFTEPLWVVVDLDYMVELAIPKSRDSVAEDPDARLVELEAKAKFYQAEYEYLCRKMPNAMFVVDPEQDCIVEATMLPVASWDTHAIICCRVSPFQISTRMSWKSSRSSPPKSCGRADDSGDHSWICLRGSRWTAVAADHCR